LDPNTTSTRTRNESELILLVPVLGTSQSESGMSQKESGNIMVGRVLGRVPGAWYE